MSILEIPPTAAATAQIEPWLQERAQELGVPANIVFSINLGLEEWLANLLTHADLPDLGEPIRIVLDRVGDGVAVTVTDRGVPFDPMQIAVAPMQGELAEATPGGQGVHLIRLFCQELRYETLPGENRLLLFFFVPPAAGKKG